VTDDAEGDAVPVRSIRGRRPAAEAEFRTDAVRDPAGEGPVGDRRDGCEAAAERLFLGLTRELVGANCREAVERTVCDRIAAADGYAFAWVGERSLERDGVTVRDSAGADGDDPDALVGSPDGRPWRRALSTGEARVATVDGGEVPVDDAPDAVAVAAVPLRHDGTVHGVLVVYADRPDGFGERELEGLVTVGRTAGFVVEAGRHRDLLFGEGTVELTVKLTARDSFLVVASAAHDCTLTVAGQVPTRAEWLVYCDVEGATADDVVATAADDDRVEHCRTISDHADGHRVELAFAESSLLREVAAAGTTVRSAVSEDGVCRLVLEVPRSVDVRSVVATLRSVDPGVELLSRQDCDGPPEPQGAAAGVLDDLTDRQRDVLEAAYRAGYFEWPRESTAEEVAASLDLATPTVLGHVRKAENRIFSPLFD
jgi:predicted DNA binding protein